MRALQYALVLVVQAVLVLAVVAGIKAFAHVDPMQGQPDDRAATVPAPAPGPFSALNDALAGH